MNIRFFPEVYQKLLIKAKSEGLSVAGLVSRLMTEYAETL